MRLLAFLFVLFLATPGWAGWTGCPGVAADTGTDTAKPSPSRDICLRQTTAADPSRVDARACRNGVDVIFASDIAGTNYDAALYLFYCPATSANAEPATITDCEKILTSGVDQAMTGNPIGNLDAVYGISPSWLAFQLANTGSRSLEIRVICH